MAEKPAEAAAADTTAKQTDVSLEGDDTFEEFAAHGESVQQCATRQYVGLTPQRRQLSTPCASGHGHHHIPRVCSLTRWFACCSAPCRLANTPAVVSVLLSTLLLLSPLLSSLSLPQRRQRTPQPRRTSVQSCGRQTGTMRRRQRTFRQSSSRSWTGT